MPAGSEVPAPASSEVSQTLLPGPGSLTVIVLCAGPLGRVVYEGAQRLEDRHRISHVLATVFAGHFIIEALRNGKWVSQERADGCGNAFEHGF